MPSLRLFIAIETHPDIRSQIGAIRDRLRVSNADVRWEPDEKLHATLKFLGSTDEGLLPEIVSISTEVCRTVAPFRMQYAGVGCFPNQRGPRIIWVGMEDLQGTLGPLQLSIESALVPLGFKPEDRRFHAHVTIGRVKSEKRIGSLIRTMESVTFESQPVMIREISIVKSDLKPSGSVYTTLQTIPLTA